MLTSESVPRPPLWKSKGFQLALGVSISLVCLGFAAQELIRDAHAREQFVEAFRSADYRLLPVLIGMLVSLYALKAYRWRLLLSPLGDYGTWRDCFGPMISGFAVNNVLPARAGEVVRVMVFARRSGLPVASVLTTVVLERILDMLSILVFLSVGLLNLPEMPDALRDSALFIGAVATVGVAGAVVFLVWTSLFVRFVNWGLALCRVPESLRAKVSRILETAVTGLASLKSPTKLAVIVVVSLLQWGLNGALMYLSLRSFGVVVPIPAALVLLGVVALAVAVPASPGFFGVIQFCFTSTLKIFPVSPPAVLAASIYYHMIQYIPVTLYGLLWLSRSGFQMREAGPVPQEAEAAAVPAPLPERDSPSPRVD